MEVQKENFYHEILEFAVSVVWLGIAFGIYFAGGATTSLFLNAYIGN